jgi:phospholipid/cholesterol/gamma-HCH transport system substrate-binding protein
MRSSQRAIEIAVGLFVVGGVAALFALALYVSNLTAFASGERYTVVGHFQNIGGLREQAPVEMAGVQIGRVKSIALNKETFEARVQLSISAEYDNLPSDTSAKILTSGLLGEQYIGMEPGGSPTTLQDGDELMLTQSALILEELIGQFLYDKASGGDE